MWKMLHENNAIEAMGVSVRFSEVLNSKLVDRMIREIEKVSSAMGLIDRQPIEGIHVNLAAPNSVSTVRGSGVLLQRNSLLRNPAGQVEQVLTMQVELSANQIVFQTWRYDRWAREREHALRLLSGPLRIAIAAVRMASVRLEYLDRFYFDGDAAGASAASLLKKGSPWISPHAFDADDLWHSHSGKFLDAHPEMRTLAVVNADAQDLTAPQHLAGRRSLVLLSGVERQFANPGWELEEEDVENFLATLMDDLHDSAINLFRDVIDPAFADKNGLPHD